MAADVPVGAPGRGLTHDKFHFLAAVPRVGGGPSTTTGLAEATTDLVGAIRSQWAGAGAPPVRILPTQLPVDALPSDFGNSKGELALGLDEKNLLAFGVDFDTDPYLVVFGESESGKTSLLRLLAQRISKRYTPQEAQLVVVDYRRSLVGELPSEYVTKYVRNGLDLQSHIEGLVDFLEKRMPPSDVTAEQLRHRSWYKGPDVFLLVDDYDLVATASGNPSARSWTTCRSRGTSGCAWCCAAIRRGRRGRCMNRSCSTCGSRARTGSRSRATSPRAR